MQMNSKLLKEIQENDIVRQWQITSARIRWLENMMRMEDSDEQKKSLMDKLRRERRERPRSRYMDAVPGDLARMGISRWRELAENREY